MVYLDMLLVGLKGYKDKDLLVADEFEGNDKEVVARQPEHCTRPEGNDKEVVARQPEHCTRPLKRFKGIVSKQMAREENSRHDQFNLRVFPRSSICSRPH